jgi:hypothetical protein
LFNSFLHFLVPILAKVADEDIVTEDQEMMRSALQAMETAESDARGATGSPSKSGMLFLYQV